MRKFGTIDKLSAAEQALPKVSSRATEGRSRGLSGWFSSSLGLFVLLLSLVATLFGSSIGISSLLIILRCLLIQLGLSFLGKFAVGTDSSNLFSVAGRTLLSRLSLCGLSCIDLVVKDTHALGLAIGDKVHSHLLVGHQHLVNVVEATSLELEIAALRQSSDDTFSNSNIFETRIAVEDLLNVVTLLNLCLVNQMVEFTHLDFEGGLGIVADPGKLCRLLEVFVCLVDSGSQLEGILSFLTLRDRGIAPLHQSAFSSNLKVFGVHLFDKQVFAVHDWLGAEFGVLIVQRLCAGLRSGRTILDGQLDRSVFANCRIAGNHWVENFLVGSPDLVPLHVHSVSGGTLLKHEILESLLRHSAAHDTLDGRESWVVPAIDMVVLDEPPQLTLGKAGTQQVQLGEVINFDWSEIETLLDPGVERVSVTVLDGSQSVSDTLN